MSESFSQDRLHRAFAGFRAFVEEVRDSGVDGFPKTAVSGQRIATAEANRTTHTPEVTPPAPECLVEGDDGAANSALEEIRADIGDCRRCKLCSGRTNIVFGVGNPRARVVFVGEGPGEDEDLKGEPFVGRAGQLLTDIITRGMGLRRSDVYIANVVKCRPPGNRNPEPDEIAACQPFLLRQIEAIRPKVIVALGKFAAQTLLESKTPISKLRGQWHEYRGTRLMPTFHPSYLLRNPADKKLVWKDIQLVMRELGLPLPDRTGRELGGS
ncbi:MAG: uracil-DNA glycosylase [Candidatus Binatia bacterium]